MGKRQHKKRSRKAGLPPGSLVHIGERKVEKARVTLFLYNERDVQERVVDAVEECSPDRLPRDGVKWINVDGLHDVEVLEELGGAYGLHPLTVEDILNTHQRPKVENFDDYVFLVIRMLQLDPGSGRLQSEQLGLVLGTDFVLTFQEREGDVLDPVRRRIRNSKGRIRAMAADYLAYALVDTTVDHYFAILEYLEERIEGLESAILEGSESDTLQVIQGLRRELIEVRRTVWPLREVVGGLERGSTSLVRDTTRVYLRDVYDHAVQIIDTMESLRDLIAGILELHLSAVSNRMNTIMKVLTIIATIFIPLTFIAGVYGMNFEYMPELRWRWAYPAVLAVMAGIGVLMLAYFRKKQWL